METQTSPTQDWEEWEDDQVVTPTESAEQTLINAPLKTTSRAPSSRLSRIPTTRLQRLKSRKRQQAQNAKAGIRLITDMTSLRPGVSAQQLRTPDGRPIKFVDAAALKALEGEPSSASVGNWNWFKKNKGRTPTSANPNQPDQDISPEDRPILIGLAIDTGETRHGAMNRSNLNPGPRAPVEEPISPSSTALAAEAATSRWVQEHTPTNSSPLAQNHMASAWSPDTPNTTSTLASPRAVSSVYSQATMTTMTKIHGGSPVPPVPALPANLKKTPHNRLISMEMGNNDEDDGGTPCTLFEEDGIPSPQRREVQARAKNSALTPDSAGSRSYGWWDHVVTPFLDKRQTFSSRKQKLESPQEEHPADSVVNEKGERPLPPLPQPSPLLIQAPIVREPVPRRTPSPRAAQESGDGSPCSSRSSATIRGDSGLQEKPRIVITDSPALSDCPPPYSSPRRVGPAPAAPVRYRAVFPPGHPLHAQFPPSPGPGSPGLAATMTSQGATQMSEIPLTPSVDSRGGPPAHAPLPMRPIGTFLPQEHAHEARGDINKIERQRRRHEKEDVAARRCGGLWRNRGCVPAGGCFGRTGAEGRKRRRVCCGIWTAVIAILVLVIVLPIMLTRPGDSEEPVSIWVNLTDFPPMPTGVLTVVGPDKTLARSTCTAPETLWSCSLPKEEHESVAPYNHDQPTVTMQIQWDNRTQESWNAPNGEAPPSALSRRGLGVASLASSLIRGRQVPDFVPEPAAPSFEEMWFLGDTTDGINSTDKAGEPTPFYLSLLGSADQSVALKKRQDDESDEDAPGDLSDPELEADGTPAPARLLPRPSQQPVRLYDRGLPSEHYGFYTYFERSIYLRSVSVPDDAEADLGNIPIDEDGGSRKNEAAHLVTWAETRMLVQIWTRKLDAQTSSLLSPDRDGLEPQLIRPGTMPYPVTVKLDTHGGDGLKKAVRAWPMDERQQVDLDGAEFLVNAMDQGGSFINGRARGDEKFGGFDGGDGGCMCEWVNFT